MSRKIFPEKGAVYLQPNSSWAEDIVSSKQYLEQQDAAYTPDKEEKHAFTGEEQRNEHAFNKAIGYNTQKAPFHPDRDLLLEPNLGHTTGWYGQYQILLEYDKGIGTSKHYNIAHDWQFVGFIRNLSNSSRQLRSDLANVFWERVHIDVIYPRSYTILSQRPAIYTQIHQEIITRAGPIDSQHENRFDHEKGEFLDLCKYLGPHLQLDELFICWQVRSMSDLLPLTTEEAGESQPMQLFSGIRQLPVSRIFELHLRIEAP